MHLWDDLYQVRSQNRNIGKPSNPKVVGESKLSERV